MNSTLNLSIACLILLWHVNKASHHYHHKKHGMPYNFAYGIKDDYGGPTFSRKESSDGSKVVGSYRVQLPDGRIQIVTYEADHHRGFVAHVTYKGIAHYPTKVGPPFVVKPHYSHHHSPHEHYRNRH